VSFGDTVASMKRSTAIVLWTLACGLLAAGALGFLGGLTCYVIYLFDLGEPKFSIRPLYIFIPYAVGAAGGLVLAFRGVLPGTKERSP